MFYLSFNVSISFPLYNLVCIRAFHHGDHQSLENIRTYVDAPFAAFNPELSLSRLKLINSVSNFPPSWH